MRGMAMRSLTMTAAAVALTAVTIGGTANMAWAADVGTETGGVAMDASVLDAASSGYSVSIPESIPLRNEHGSSEPGRFSGSAVVAVGGEIYDGRKLTISVGESAVMTDAMGWSNPVEADVSLPGMGGMDAAEVRNGMQGEVKASAELAPGKWTGTATFTIEVTGEASFAVYSADDKSLSFYKRGAVPAIGGAVDGRTVTGLYMNAGVSGYSKASPAPWHEHAADIDKVEVVDDGISPLSTACWFWDLPQLAAVEGLERLDMSRCTDAYGMFMEDSALTALDLSGWKSTKLKSVQGIAQDCMSLASLNVRGLDVSHTSNMSWALAGCQSLKSIDGLDTLDTSAAATVSCMFFDCVSLEGADVASWDTSSVTDMSRVFHGCSALRVLDIKAWDVSSATTMYRMLNGCKSLATLDLAGWKPSSCTNMQCLFELCSNLTSLDVTGWDTSSAQNMGWMMSSCPKLADIRGLAGLNTSSATAIDGFFYNDAALEDVDVSSWDVSCVADASNLFFGCKSIATLDLSGWKTDAISNTSYMLKNCPALATVYAGSGWDVSGASSYKEMFKGCVSIVGGAGTVYDADKVGKEMAVVDGGADAPGYLTGAVARLDEAKGKAAKKAGKAKRAAASNESNGVQEAVGAISSTLYTETDGTPDGAADTVRATWWVSVPDSIALQKDGNDGAPGEYAGVAQVGYGGEFGTAQRLTVEASDAELADSKGWSLPVMATVSSRGLSGLSYADVRAGGTGTARFTAYLAPGKWIGHATFAISLEGAAR